MAHPRTFEVLLTAGAEQDLEDIHAFIGERDGWQRASHVLDEIERTLRGLARFPERGSMPPELLALGMREYRQTLCMRWRLIYRVLGRRVVIYLIAHERRDMRTLLQRRLLGTRRP